MPKLTEYFDEMSIEFICEHLDDFKRMRCELIRKEANKGGTREKLAERFNVSVRYVYKILNKVQ